MGTKKPDWIRAEAIKYLGMSNKEIFEADWNELYCKISEAKEKETKKNQKE